MTGGEPDGDVETGDGPRHRGIAAATIGNALEFYDFITYAFFAVQIGRTFFPGGSPFMSLMLSLATFGAGFATRPVGAWVLGAYADRAGRRSAMLASFALMGAAIATLALVPSYRSIGVAAPVLAIAARLVQGFALGGEVGSTTAYLLEAAPPRGRALAVSWQAVSQNIAATAGALVGTLLTGVLSGAALDAYGWRIAFLLGAATLPAGLYLRRALPETLERTPTIADRPRLRAHGRLVLLSLLIMGNGTIANYTFQYMATLGQTALHLSARVSLLAEVANNGIGIGAALLGGWLADRHGRRAIMIGPNLACLVLAVPAFWWVTRAGGAAPFLLTNFVFGVLINLPWGAFYAALAECLPPGVRGRGFALTYAVAIAAFGGTTQPIAAWLIHASGSTMAIAWYLTGATAVGTVAMLWLPTGSRAGSPQARAAVAAIAA